MIQFKALSKKDAKILAAMAGGIIPRGGDSFDIGAADYEEAWLTRTDYWLFRAPALTRVFFRLALKLLNYYWPMRYEQTFRAITKMSEAERTHLFHKIESSGPAGAASLILPKILIFPAFYGLKEVKEAIGYLEKFSNSPEFEGTKE